MPQNRNPATPAARALGQRIAAAREQIGWSLSDAAEEYGCTKAQWCQWEQAHRTPKFDAVCRIAWVLKCTLRDLVPTLPEITFDTEPAAGIFPRKKRQKKNPEKVADPT